jgi:hypothetical protein
MLGPEAVQRCQQHARRRVEAARAHETLDAAAAPLATITVVMIITIIVTAIDGLQPNLYDAARVVRRYTHHDVAEPYVVGVARHAAADADKKAHAHVKESALHIRRHSGRRRRAWRAGRQGRDDDIVPADAAEVVRIAVHFATPLWHAVGDIEHGAGGDQLDLLNADDTDRVLGEL